jgi:hypothetical protein
VLKNYIYYSSTQNSARSNCLSYQIKIFIIEFCKVTNSGVIVSNNFICLILHFSQWCGGAVISAGPQLTAGGASNSADIANVGSGGPVPSQQG